MRADGTLQTRLTNDAANDANPDWSPDGSQITFQTARDGNHEIYVADVEHENRFALTVTAVNDGPPVAVDDFYATDEDTALNSDGDWFDTDWQFRRTISFDNSARPENLVNFPVLIKLHSSNIDYTKTHDQGDDLRFFDSDGTALAHEIEVWDESGTSYVWVKIPQIDASSDTDSIHMYYGNLSVVGDGQDAAEVWSDYRAVYHLNEDPGATGTVTDAAGNFERHSWRQGSFDLFESGQCIGKCVVRQ